MELIKPGDEENPICPHCENELTQVVAKKVTKQFDKPRFVLTEKFVYSCPHCRKVLGVGQSAWM